MPELSDAPHSNEPEELQENARRRVQMSKSPYPELQMPLGYEEICRIIPHRYPFLLVDKITELEPGKRCVGIKNVTANEEYFQGHFPGHPVMPGVLALEAMAQVAGVLILVSRNTPGALSYFATIEKARFRQPVRPGDTLVTEVSLQVLRGQVGKVSVVGRVDGRIVVEADYTFFTAQDERVVESITKHAAQPGQTPLITGASNGAQTEAPKALSDAPSSSNGAHSASPASSSPPVPAPPSVPSSPAVASASSSVNGMNGRASGSVPKSVQIHPTAVVDPRAEIGENVFIGPYCVVENGVRLGAETHLEAHVVIKRGTTLGARCRVSPGAVLGGEPQDLKFKGEESFLHIGNDNRLREMVTIHRATGEGEATTLGDNNLLMAYVHIGHNCIVGSNNMISNSTGISGHVTVEDKCVIGGFVGVHQFVHIGKMAMVGGLSKVVQDVPPFCMADGRPAKTHGLNIRGLRRNGVESEVRMQVSQAVKLLYRSGLNTTDALQRVREEIPRSETLDYLVDFLERVREGRLGRQDEAPPL